ncbi:hypothetical protein BIU82_00215 [Arthrobacter sp. SW1]|uniref:hypothetical protein n=1 Tax=Arthrobacter sp. SW1 TaxID=1920889 RepID=UPI000877BA2F|nr:hypothetical protein [Arthrobacter sp. SW1]OFI39541.1 hypothetical protein BIU82_00215 [Arthrobacter sp. SW1]
MLEHDELARHFIEQIAGLVNGLEQLASATETTHPATSRHLRMLSQQYAAIALTAVETWPQVVSNERG